MSFSNLHSTEFCLLNSFLPYFKKTNWYLYLPSPSSLFSFSYQGENVRSFLFPKSRLLRFRPMFFILFSLFFFISIFCFLSLGQSAHTQLSLSVFYGYQAHLLEHRLVSFRQFLSCSFTCPSIAFNFTN